MSGWGLRMPPAFPEQAWLRTFGNGRLYNWYAVNTGLLAPTGWRVPTQDELTTLVNFLGGASVAGGPLKSTRTGLTPGWNAPNTGATNASGFNALGAGIRILLDTGAFKYINSFLFLWGNTEPLSTQGYMILIDSANTLIVSGGRLKSFGFSVRCILDNPANWSPGMMVTDVDGNSYTTVKIGTQVWMGSNLKTTRYNDGTIIPFAGSNGVNFTNAEWAALTTPGQCTYNNGAIAEYIDVLQAQTQP